MDEEGFTIRPKDAEKISSQFWDQDLDRDSSDFESDDGMSCDHHVSPITAWWFRTREEDKRYQDQGHCYC